MINQRKKGKRYERKAAQLVRPFFPNVQRNAGVQSREGGCDLINTDPFNFEIKAGKSYVSRMNRDMLDQVAGEGKKFNYDVVMVFPHREKPYVIMPIEDLLSLIDKLKIEKLL